MLFTGNKSIKVLQELCVVSTGVTVTCTELQQQNDENRNKVLARAHKRFLSVLKRPQGQAMDITQRTLVACYRCFATANPIHGSELG